MASKLLPWVGGLLGLCFFHRYTIHSCFDLVQSDPGDSRFVVLILENWSEALRGRVSWSSPPIFYPVTHVIAYSDLLLGPGLIFAAIRIFGAQPFLAFNVTLVLLSLLSYAASCWLIRSVLGFRAPAAVAGGLFFAFAYPKAAQLVHAQLRFDCLLPIIFGLFWQLVRDGGSQKAASVIRRAVILGILFEIQAASSFYNAWFLALLILVFTALSLITREVRQRLASLLRAHLWPLMLSAGVWTLLAIPLFAIYRPVMQSTGGHPWNEVLEFLPRLPDLLWQGTEAYVWGGYFRRFPELIAEHWPEKRIGFGFVTSLLILGASVWACVRLVHLARGREERLAGETETALLNETLVPILMSSVLTLTLLAVRWPSGLTAWNWVYEWVPLASGIRAVPRMFIVLTLPLAISLAWFIDRATEAIGKLAQPPQRMAMYMMLCSAVAFVIAEQCCKTFRYSARQAYGFEDQVAARVNPSCSSFYLMPTSAMRAPSLTSESFNAAKYLEVNPDVAKNWKGTAWGHYEQFGRSEGRFVDAESAHAHEMLVPHYNETGGLVALMTGIPTLNGYSGTTPAGYRLSDGFVPDIEQRVEEWTRRNAIKPPCLVQVELSEWDIRVVRPPVE